MSGHSKWATTKRQKAVTDAAKGQLFTKLARAITVAARQGGGDPSSNPTLRYTIDKARAANTPGANIERAIARGTGTGAESELVAWSFEIVGPQGVALLVEGVTDNKNRTSSEIRNLVQAHHAKVAQPGSQRWQFAQVGRVFVTATEKIDEIELAAIEANALDTRVTPEGVEVQSDPADLARVREALKAKGFSVGPGELAFVPKQKLEASSTTLQATQQLVEALHERDDVQNVWSNLT